MQKFVKNILFLLFFVSFAGGVFYMSTSQDFLHFTEKAFLGEVLKEAKNRVLTRDFSIELEGADEEEILWQKATPQDIDQTAPICTASYDPNVRTSGSVVVTLTCSEPVEFCAMDDYSDCPQPGPLPATPGIPCSRALDITYNGFTIMACNLGATEVGTGTTSYGNYYQRGNNYPMGDASVATYSPTSSTQVDASTFWPNNPYSNDTFIKNNNRDSSNNQNLRWGSGDTITGNGIGTREDRQGPCPDGYHVPSIWERRRLLWWLSGWIAIENTFFLPKAWIRTTSASLSYKKLYGYYRSSSPSASDTSKILRVQTDDSQLYLAYGNFRGIGHPIRCFKNEYDPPSPKPCSEAPDITYNGITIMACNLGATEVYDGINNAASYGYYYQWWNNYPMWDWSVATYTPNSSTVVSAAGFWPNNPFSSATFIKKTSWDSSNNQNLRWGSGDTTTGNGIGTQEDRQGPCPDGYHVPSALERSQLLAGIRPDIYTNFLLLPPAGYRQSSNGSLKDVGPQGYYWSSSPSDTKSIRQIFSYNSGSSRGGANRGLGYSIRCFKNSLP